MKLLKEGRLNDKQVTQFKYQRYIKDYLRCVASVDDNIGRLLKHLDDTGQSENTLVLFYSPALILGFAINALMVALVVSGTWSPA